MTDGSLVNFGDLTTPMTVLIEKISEAGVGLSAPWQIKRRAKADAVASLIRAQSEIDVDGLRSRALHRVVEEEAQKQSNMENILRNALPLIEEDSVPQDVENDWIANFFDKCRIVRDDDMQELWSKVLAGEANAPGAFSRRTVNMLNDLDKEDAQLFTRLCGFGWEMGNFALVVVDDRDQIYGRCGIKFETLSHLESLGLIKCGGSLSFLRNELPKTFTVCYYGESVELIFPKDTDNELRVGRVIVTRAGEELSRVCRPQPVEGFVDYVCRYWEARGVIIASKTDAKNEDSK